MDLGFTRLEPMLAQAVSIPFDYFRLTASLSAMQAASPTAVAEARLRGGTFADGPLMVALVELIAGGPEWMGAANALNGSFHPPTATKYGGKTV